MVTFAVPLVKVVALELRTISCLRSLRMVSIAPWAKMSVRTRFVLALAIWRVVSAREKKAMMTPVRITMKASTMTSATPLDLAGADDKALPGVGKRAGVAAGMES